MGASRRETTAPSDSRRLRNEGLPLLRNGSQTFMDGVDLGEVAEQVGTPFYCYSTAVIERQFGSYSDALSKLARPPLIAFAVKANPNGSILRLLGNLGAGADVVSGGELFRARRAGILAESIVFSGVGKSEEELVQALRGGIYQFNIESEAEAVTLSRLATNLQTSAPVAIRVNPDVSTGTHPKISTGSKGDKFGIPIKAALQVCKEVSRLPGLQLQGLAMHVGSQLTGVAPVLSGLRKIRGLLRQIRGEGLSLETIDVGGGLGVQYEHGQSCPPTIAEYCRAVCAETADWEVRLIFEPGRSLVAEAGTLVARAVRWKRGDDKSFLVLDAAMNDFARPSMYGAWHDIEPLHASNADTLHTTIVGPVCESSDTFAFDREFPAIPEGSLVVIRDTGAYGATMASTYNSRLPVPEVLTFAGRYAIVRRRPELESLVADEETAPWLTT